MAGGIYAKRHDTRRRDAAGRLIGSRNGCQYTRAGTGRYLKRKFHRAERKRWRAEVYGWPVRKSFSAARSDLNWRGT